MAHATQQAAWIPALGCVHRHLRAQSFVAVSIHTLRIELVRVRTWMFSNCSLCFLPLCLATAESLATGSTLPNCCHFMVHHDFCWLQLWVASAKLSLSLSLGSSLLIVCSCASVLPPLISSLTRTCIGHASIIVLPLHASLDQTKAKTERGDGQAHPSTNPAWTAQTLLLTWYKKSISMSGSVILAVLATIETHLFSYTPHRWLHYSTDSTVYLASA